MADTIAAIATGGIISAIGIVRVSGDRAIEIADEVFTPTFTKKRVKEAKDRQLIYGELRDEKGETIDICLCTVSRGPGSYTGEDTAEFQCHGSPVVLAAALRSLFAAGARQALPGEFTKRAFLNGRMDLSQAEAVVDIIDAETLNAAKNAVGQLGGAMGRKTEAIRSGLIDIMAHFHAVIDYPDEDIDEFCLENYASQLEEAEGRLKALLDTYDRGRILKDGVKCAIIGKPNAGKSSLLNALVGYDRAIVTDIAGTTRDTIEEKVKVGETVLRLVDTAGIRETEDEVERLGVERSIEAADMAELVIAVFDGSRPFEEEDERVLNSALNSPRTVAVINKSDLPQRIDRKAIEDRCQNICVVSALTGSGVKEIEKAVGDMFSQGDIPPSGEIVANERHADAIKRAKDAIASGRGALKSGITPDAVLTEIEAAISALGEITGGTVREDITDRIFSRFCVGK